MKRRRREVEFEGFGGELLAKAGCKVHEDLVSFASMGFGFLGHLQRYIRIIRAFDRMIVEACPTAALLVDSPALNFILARLARWRGLPIVYYICPQIWAWAPWRRSKVLKYTDLLLSILPFEQRLYRNPRVPVVWVGHPVADSLSLLPPDAGERLRASLGISPSKQVIALLPGSRDHEVRELMPLFRGIVDRMRLDPGRHCLLVSSLRESFRQPLEEALEGCRIPHRILGEDSRIIAMASDFVLVASGTASLEVAYLEKPMMVLYWGSALIHFLFHLLAVTPFFALPNILGASLIDGNPMVFERLCRGSEADELAPVARSLLEPGPAREKAIENLRRLKAATFAPGASSRSAEALLEFLGKLEGEKQKGDR